MEETNKIWGMDKGALAVIGLSLTNLAVVISLFNMLNSGINRLDANMTAMRSELKSDIGALRSELKADIREIRDELNTLGSELNAAKIDIAEIKVRVAEIERRMPPLESMDNRLDNLELEMAQLRERVDALSAESE